MSNGFKVFFAVALVVSQAHATPGVRKYLGNSPDTDRLQKKLFDALNTLHSKYAGGQNSVIRYQEEEPWGEETLTLDDGVNSISCRADYGESIPPRSGGYDPHYSCSFALASLELTAAPNQATTTTAGLLNEAVVGSRTQAQVVLGDAPGLSDGNNAIRCTNPRVTRAIRCTLALPGASN